MKNASLKRIITTVLSIVLVLSVVFVISSCKKHEHTLVKTTITEASCAETGTLQIKCTDEKCDYVATESIPATGHNNVVSIITAPTCTTDGKVQTRCTNCGETKNDVVKAQGHDEILVKAKSATCTIQGYPEHYKCQNCTWTTLKSSDVINPLGHISSDWKDDRQNSRNEYSIQYPTCTEGGYHYSYKECTRCGYNLEYVKVEDAPLGHDISVEQARAAGCCIGWDTFEYCNGWSKSEMASKGYPYAPIKNGYYIAPSGENIKEASKGCGYNTYVEHPAVYDHVMTSELKYVEVKAATCEADGVYALISECTTCAVTSNWPSWCRPVWDKPTWYTPSVVVYTEFTVTPDGTEKGVIEALGHEWQTHAAQAETCTVDGWETFTMCTRCSQIDLDLDGTPDTREVPVIPACHIFQPDGCYNVCVREVVREDGSVGKCGHISVEDPYHHDVVTLTGKEYDAMTGLNTDESMAPTCVDAGFYTCIKYCNDCKRIITREIVRIDPHGHDYVDHIAKKPTCTTVGWEAFKTCTRCDYTDFVQIDKLGHTPSATAEVKVVTVANCIYEGLEKHVYRCTVCNGVDENDENMIKMVKIPKTACDLVKVTAKAATCTDDGHNDYEYCTVCDYTTIVVYEKLGHDIKTIPAQAATCTEQGWNDYGVCQRADCGFNNKEEMMTKALGHDMVPVAIQEPTCTEVGYVAHLDCSRCDYTEGKDEIPETGHKGLDPVEEAGVAATCLAGGNYYLVIYCGNPNCGEELDRKSVPTDALGHAYSNSTGYCTNTGCNDRISIGLSYSNNADGTTCVVSGIGSCTDTEIIIPDEINGRKVVGIAEYSFSGEDSITKVVIGNNVTSIGNYAFSRCENISTVVIGKLVSSIGRAAFERCDSLGTVEYRGTVAQWNAIVIGTGNGDLTGATRKYI